jgi:hypothetical protein
MSGRPKKNPPSGAAGEIRGLAAHGYSKIGIAANFAVSVTTLDRWIDEDEEIRECFVSGKEDERFISRP